MTDERREAFRRKFIKELQLQEVKFDEVPLYRVNCQLDGIAIKHKDETIRNIFYIDDVYNDYLDGHSINKIIQHILKRSKENVEAEEVVNKAKSCLEDGSWKNYLIAEVINTARNTELLKTLPHREILDLSVIYRICFEDGKSFVIKNESLDMRGMPETELFEIAKKNILKLRPFVKFYLGGGLHAIMNASKCYAASALLFDSVLKDMAEYAEGNIYILPSSIHELFFINASKQSESALLDTIRGANREVVTQEEFLSDNLYFYDKNSGCLKMIEQR